MDTPMKIMNTLNDAVSAQILLSNNSTNKKRAIMKSSNRIIDGVIYISKDYSRFMLRKKIS